MITIKFDPDTSLIKFFVTLEYLTKSIFLMAFDPGSSKVAITPEAAYLLGYKAKDLKYSQETITASGEEKVSEVKLKAIELEGERIENISAVVMPLPKQLKIDGLLGLNFLQHFKVTLDVSEGILTFERK